MPSSATLMVHELRELHNRIKATTVYVTHDQLEAMSMADKIAVMNNGVIEQFGTPQEIYDRPATMFVADFIGSPPMNFLRFRGRASRRRRGRSGSTAPPVAVPRPPMREDTSRSSADLALGVRPEHIRLDDRPRPARRRSSAPNISAPPRSSTIDTGDGTVKAQVSSFGPSHPLGAGEPVGLAFRPSGCRCSTARSTGRAIRTALFAAETKGGIGMAEIAVARNHPRHQALQAERRRSRTLST